MDTSVRRFTVRSLVEILVATGFGFAAIIGPIILDSDLPSQMSFFILLRQSIDHMKFYSVGILTVIGFALGLVGRERVLILGPSVMLAFPALSAVDMLFGGEHNLWPFEFFIYGLLSLIGLVGAALGRGVKLIFKRVTREALGSSIRGGCQETKSPSVPQNGE